MSKHQNHTLLMPWPTSFKDKHAFDCQNGPIFKRMLSAQVSQDKIELLVGRGREQSTLGHHLRHNIHRTEGFKAFYLGWKHDARCVWILYIPLIPQKGQ